MKLRTILPPSAPPPQRIRIFKIANTFKTLKTLTFLLVKIFWITIKNDATCLSLTCTCFLTNPTNSIPIFNRFMHSSTYKQDSFSLFVEVLCLSVRLSRLFAKVIAIYGSTIVGVLSQRYAFYYESFASIHENFLLIKISQWVFVVMIS